MITHKNNKMYLISDTKNGLSVYVDKHFYTTIASDEIFQELNDCITYNEDAHVILYGKKILIPRKQTAYGDIGTKYSFSGVTVNAKQWIPVLLKIKEDIEYFTSQKFNFCLVNYYEDGSKNIGYHKDDEKDLGDNPSIVSLSFGAKRKFYFKSDNKDVPVVKLELNHGCLCWMVHPTNTFWKHSVPKEPKIKLPRINLTFRYINI